MSLSYFTLKDAEHAISQAIRSYWVLFADLVLAEMILMVTVVVRSAFNTVQKVASSTSTILMPMRQ